MCVIWAHAEYIFKCTSGSGNCFIVEFFPIISRQKVGVQSTNLLISRWIWIQPRIPPKALSFLENEKENFFMIKLWSLTTKHESMFVTNLAPANSVALA